MMKRPSYHPLSREQVGRLMAPGNAGIQQAWSRLRSALHGIVAMLSVTYPRPLYHYEQSARRTLTEEPGRLRGTPFHSAAMQNVQAAEEIERMFREHGHTPELHEVVDAYLDALLDEFEEMRLYPEIPPARMDALGGVADQHRAVAGR